MLDKQSVVLVIVDVQGKLVQAMHDRESLIKNLQILMRGAKILGIPIICAEQYPKGLGPTVPELQEIIQPWQPIEKNCFSCCQNEDFMEAVRDSGKSQILLAGIESHICVYQTARDLLEQNYAVEVVADAVSSRTEANKHIGIEKIVSLGGSFTSTEMALYELLKVAQGDQFKEILKLVK